MRKKVKRSTKNLFRNKKFINFAHRGFSKKHTENTLEAFKEAHKVGYDFFELDVRSSKDGVVYVFHDQDFKRLIGKKVFISDLLSSQIDKIRLPEGYKVLKLEKLFTLFPNVFFNIDIKSNDTILPFCKLIRNFKIKNKICIASFSDSRINKLIKNLGEDVVFAMGRNRVITFFIYFLFGINYRSSATCIQLPTHFFMVPIISKKIIKYAQNLNYKLHVWTVNSEKEMIKYIEMGVDGIMTDECILLKSVLLKKGIWIKP